MTGRSFIALVLGSAIGAELALFAVYLLSSPRRRAPALYLLAALALCLALLAGGNLLAARFVWAGLPGTLLFLDLLTPPLIFLYAVQIGRGPAPLRRRDALHAAPALLGVVAWEAGLLQSMDIYVNVCWLVYLSATGWRLVTRRDDYVPASRQRFLTLLFCVMCAIWLLRLAIVLDPNTVPAFRESVPYLLILGALFSATCLMLLTALRHPDLLSVPGSHVKYAQSAAPDSEIDALELRLDTLLREHQPYLDPDFALADLAALLETQPRLVSQLINSRRSMSFSAYMNALRTDVAAKALEKTDKSMKTIMFESGFRSKSIFNREFQRHFGTNPTEYRQRKRAA
jgi:AraC-like DNA-binding protein